MLKDARITLRINEQEKEKIEAAAAKRDIPAAQLIRQLIKDYLSKEE